MPSMTTHRGPFGYALAALVAGAFVWTAVGHAQAPAQAPPPQRQLVAIVQLNPDQVVTWEDLIKNQAMPAAKKNGTPWRHVYANGVAGTGFTRVTITPITNYAQFDQPGGVQRAFGAEVATKYNAKLAPTIHSQQTYIQTLNLQSSIMGNSTTPASFVVVQSFRVLPGKGGDFQASLRDDFLPAYRKAGVREFLVFGTNFGGVDGVMARPIAKYAELDQPGLLQRAGLPEEAQTKINARRNATLAGPIETNIYRFIPELSYGIPAPARATN
jgi:hypothetical protein